MGILLLLLEWLGGGVFYFTWLPAFVGFLCSFPAIPARESTFISLDPGSGLSSGVGWRYTGNGRCANVLYCLVAIDKLIYKLLACNFFPKALSSSPVNSFFFDLIIMAL